MALKTTENLSIFRQQTADSSWNRYRAIRLSSSTKHVYFRDAKYIYVTIWKSKLGIKRYL